MTPTTQDQVNPTVAGREYGTDIVERLSADFSARHARDFSVRNVWLMRAFYPGWPIVQTPSAESLLDTIRSGGIR